MPSIIACWCTKCDDFQEDGRSCAVCGTALSILPLVDTMRHLEQCQVEHQVNVRRVRQLRAEAAASRDDLNSLGFEVEEYSKSVKAFHKSAASSSASSSLGATSSARMPSTTASDRAIRRFNRWSKRIARHEERLRINDQRIRDHLAEADDTSRDVSNRLNLLRLRIRRIVQVFQTHFSGVSQEVMNALPRHICKEDGLECIFCTEDLHGATILQLPNCDHHMFHEGCVLRWLERHNSCPVCRSKIQTSQVVELPL
jgi:Ring finger domain